MRHVAAQPVELPDHDGVAISDIGEQLGEAGPVVAGTAHGVGEELGDSGGLQGSLLLVEGLGDRADADIADAGSSGVGGGHMPIVQKVSDSIPMRQRLSGQTIEAPSPAGTLRPPVAGTVSRMWSFPRQFAVNIRAGDSEQSRPGPTTGLTRGAALFGN